MFQAPTVTTSLGIVLQTVSTGDNLVDTVGDGTLGGPGPSNSAILVGDNVTGGVTANFNYMGLKTLNLNAPIAGGPVTPVGFQGTTDVGATAVNNNASLGAIRLGGAGQGLGTVLTTYNSNAASQGFFGIIQASQFSGTNNSIAANITGNLGARGNGTSNIRGGTSIELGFAPDSGANGYVNWTIMSLNNEFLRVAPGLGTNGSGSFGAGIGAAANLTLTGAGTAELSTLENGDFANLKVIDGTASGGMTLTGAAANVTGGYYSAVGVNVGAPAGIHTEGGLLTSGGGNTIAPTSIKGSTTAANFVDVSGLTAAAINAATIAGNTATGISNVLVLPNSVVEQAAALANESGYQVIGDTAITAGSITMANFTNANTLALYGPEAVNIGLVKIAAPSTFAFTMNGNTSSLIPALPIVGFHNYAITGPGGTYTGTNNIFNLNMGTATHVNAVGGTNHLAPGDDGGNKLAATAHNDVIGFFGIAGPGLVVNNYETTNFNIVDGPALPAIIPILAPIANFPDLVFGGILFTPTGRWRRGAQPERTGRPDRVDRSWLLAPFANVISYDQQLPDQRLSLAACLLSAGQYALQVEGATSGGVIDGRWLQYQPSRYHRRRFDHTLERARRLDQTADTLTSGSGQFSRPELPSRVTCFGTEWRHRSAGGHGDTVNLAAGHSAQPHRCLRHAWWRRAPPPASTMRRWPVALLVPLLLDLCGRRFHR